MSGKPTRAQQLREAVDEWEKVEFTYQMVKDQRTMTRDRVLSLGKHGQIVSASSGKRYLLRQETIETQAHAKVARMLAAELGMSMAQLSKVYDQCAGTSTKREIKAA